MPMKGSNETQRRAALPCATQVELKSGETYRGELNDAEDNWNCQLKNVTATARVRSMALPSADSLVPNESASRDRLTSIAHGPNSASDRPSSEWWLTQVVDVRAGRANIALGSHVHPWQPDQVHAVKHLKPTWTEQIAP